MELDAAGCLAATVVASCGLPPQPFDSERLPIAYHTLPSCILVESSPRHGKTLLLYMLEACVQVAFPGSTVVTLKCADLRRCRALRISFGGAPTESELFTSRWLACPGHAPLLARCAKAMESNAGLQEAHHAVAAALASTSGSPCVVLVDDVHLLVAHDSSSSAADGDAAHLDVAHALAALLCIWQCPACTATCDTAAATFAGASDAAELGAGSVCAVLTTSGVSCLPQGVFPLPHSIVCQRMAYVDDAANPSKWVRGFLRQMHSADAGSAASAVERACPSQLSFLARALTVDRPPLRMALRAAALQMMRGGAAAAFDRSASAASASCPIDLVLRIQAPPEVPRYPLRITGLQLQLRGLQHSAIAAGGTTVSAATQSMPGPTPASTTHGTVLAAGTERAAISPPAAAASAPGPATGGERTPLSLADVVCGAAAKAEALRSIVLPLLAWQHLQSGLPAPAASTDGLPTPGAADDVAALAAAMASMRVVPPTGLLLHGPPGSGKSTLAVAIARAARMRLLVVDAALLLSRFVGDSEASIRRLFRAARAASPCCLVLENLEMVGGARAGGGAGSRGADVSSAADYTFADGGVGIGAGVVADATTGVHAVADADVPAATEVGVAEAGEAGDEEVEAAEAQEAASPSSKSKPKPKPKSKLKLSQRHARTAAAAAALRPRLTRNLPAAASASAGSSDSPSAASAAAGASTAGSARGAASVHDRMLATLLTEMDGVGIKRSEAGSSYRDASGAGARAEGPMLLLIGVTEHRSAIDPALLRPGRLDRHILLPPAGSKM